ncbi:N-acyl-D-amino-acid deacylase family protein [Pseudonocardia spinosispora]|uniref:N-acyl-D-amino-acid deacylase family protein n=1 Tax=Pseudonocardia spinosispora TaxID=103441 RepID=UPI000413EE1E|nr:D-aminoacylase [Pseudonocardia spinosispora]
MNDLVINGGTVLDGTGSLGVRADVGLRDGRVQVIGEPGTVHGDARIDAAGQVVAPGFIDLHSHADFSIMGHPGADTVIHQGVTTLVTGNCGWSPFPIGDLGALRAASAFLAPELSWNWTDTEGYAEAVERCRPSVNLALQVGHSALRLAVLGGAERTPDADELERMGALLADAAAHGVWGFSTGLIYAPGAYATPDEVTALARVAAEHGLLYSTHLRNEADDLLPAVREALDTAAVSGVRLEISHLKAMGRSNHGAVVEALRLIDDARAQGVDVSCDVYPYTASSTTLTSRLPAWALDGGVEALLDRLAEPATRARIAAGLRDRMNRDVDPEGVVVAALPGGPFSGYAGSSVAEIARRLDTTPEDAALRLLAGHQGSVAVVNHAMAADDVRTVLRYPGASVASDGWVLRPDGDGQPHPRSFGTFPRVLGGYVRAGDLGLADAVHKMTGLPAARLGMTDRGMLRPGAVADITVFDPESISDRSTYDEPWQLATGVRHVFVAGRPVLTDGALTGARPGRVVRRTA